MRMLFIILESPKVLEKECSFIYDIDILLRIDYILFFNKKSLSNARNSELIQTKNQVTRNYCEQTGSNVVRYNLRI